MSVVSLDILGFRGFSHEQTLCFAQPNGKTGSGLNDPYSDPNNGGKSTIIESPGKLYRQASSDVQVFQRARAHKNWLKDRVLRFESKTGIG